MLKRFLWRTNFINDRRALEIAGSWPWCWIYTCRFYLWMQKLMWNLCRTYSKRTLSLNCITPLPPLCSHMLCFTAFTIACSINFNSFWNSSDCKHLSFLLLTFEKTNRSSRGDHCVITIYISIESKKKAMSFRRHKKSILLYTTLLFWLSPM